MRERESERGRVRERQAGRQTDRQTEELKGRGIIGSAGGKRKVFEL